MADNTRQRLSFQPAETTGTHYSVSVPETATPLLQDSVEETPTLIADYLDHLTAGLLKLPYAERDAIRTEVHLHLLASAAAFEEIGESRDRAVQQAVSQFGEPTQLARSFVRSWESTGLNRYVFPKSAMYHAVRFFMGAALIVFVFLSLLRQIPFNVAAEPTVSRILSAIFLSIPIWGGWRLGIYRRASLGTFYGVGALATAMVPILIFSSLLPPALAHAPYLGVLFAAWAPIAAISAGVSQLVSERRIPRWRLT